MTVSAPVLRVHLSTTVGRRLALAGSLILLCVSAGPGHADISNTPAPPARTPARTLPAKSPSKEELEWQSIVRAPTLDGVNAFIDRYPKSRHFAEANVMATDISDWMAIEHTVARSGYENYLGAHPGGLHVDAANRNLQDIDAWKSALKGNDPAAISRYLQEYPSGLFVEPATQKQQTIDRQQQELAACQAKQPIYRDLGNGVIQQCQNGLYWTKSSSRPDLHGTSAVSFCAKKGPDWSVPSANQLKSLVDPNSEVQCGAEIADGKRYPKVCNVSPKFQLTNWAFWSGDDRTVFDEDDEDDDGLRHYMMMVYLVAGPTSAHEYDGGLDGITASVLCVHR